MTSYATYSEMLQRYPAVEGRKGGATSVNSDLLHRATNYVNGRLSPLYSVPFSDTPLTVKDITMDVAYYYFLLDVDGKKAKAFRETEIDQRLKGIVEGREAIMTGSGTLGQSTDNVVWSSTEDYPPTFSMLDAEDSHSAVSSDRLDAEEAERE